MKKSEIFLIQNSGGRSSAYMTERLLKEAKNQNDYIISFQNTGKENDATLDFIHQCEQRWKKLYGQQVYWLEYNPDNPKGFDIVDYETAHRTTDESKPSPFEKLIKKRLWLPNRVARYCTQDLKVRTAKKFMMSLGFKCWTNCIGIRADEPNRFESAIGIASKERFIQFLPMVEWGTTKSDVDAFWKSMPFNLQLLPHEGNCDLCFLKGVGKKRQIIRRNPKAADWWMRMEKEKGSTFHKDFSVESLVDGIKAAPEFSFRDDFECDTPCFCNID